MNRRFHYDAAFEHYLRAKKIPYVSVDEARRSLHGPVKLKNFDFVVYGQSGPNLLVDVKGRKHSGRSHRALDNWVTDQDVQDLQHWQHVFGPGFKAAFVFLYWCDAQPPDALFLETFAYKDRWYAVLAAMLDEYSAHARPRSAKWNTVHTPAAAFHRISHPLMELL